MSEESKKFGADEVFTEVLEQTTYALRLLGTSRQALLESNIGKQCEGKPPRLVMMHAISKAVTECDLLNFDHKKFLRGLISVCVYLLEDDDVNIALKIKQDLLDTDK